MGRAVGKGVHFGRAPYGYRAIRTAEGVAWQQDPEEAAMIQEMYRLAVEENLGFKRIADQLAAAGHQRRGGLPSAGYTIQLILTNESLKGTLAYGKKPKRGNRSRDVVRVEGFFPAILTPEEWDRLQQRLAVRREHARGHTHASEYSLSGIVRCGTCGGPMVGKIGMSYKGRRHRNYYCSHAMQSRAACPTYNGHSARKLEQAILEAPGPI